MATTKIKTVEFTEDEEKLLMQILQVAQGHLSPEALVFLLHWYNKIKEAPIKETENDTSAKE